MPKKPKEPKITGAPKKQRGLFKKRRGGVVLTKDEVIEIKRGRKKLRRDMRKAGIKSRKEFELTASSMGLYFDKNKKLAAFLWFMRGTGGWLLLGLGALALLMLYALSLFSQYRGHFTISMSDSLFLEGFTLSESAGFENPTSHLFCTPAENVPCISITDIPENVDEIDGNHNGKYFAYTFYIRNEGETTSDYRWEVRLNSESQNLSDAAWLMVFEDGVMQFYAKPNKYGRAQTLPAADVLSEGEYTAESWASMIASYEAARELMNNADSQEEVDAAAKSLEASINELQLAPTESNKIRYEELIALLTRVDRLNENEYTEESWAALQEAYDAAVAILDKAKSQTEVNEFVTVLREFLAIKPDQTTKSGGVSGVIDYTHLSAQISRVYGDSAYIVAPLIGKCKYPDSQFEVIKKTDVVTYWRLVPLTFASDTVAAQGIQTEVTPTEVHKYTVVVWLEGDDPDCTDDLVGGHLGLEIYLELVE